MRALTIVADRKLERVERAPPPPPAAGEVQIRIKAVALLPNVLAKQAARSNGKLDEPGAVKALGEAAANVEPELRQMAVYALWFFGGESAAQLLRERAYEDEDRFVRYNAAAALARRGGICRHRLASRRKPGTR